MKRATPEPPRLCLNCDEAILPTDLPSRIQGLHFECGIRSICGSVAHQRRQCPCYGGTGDDDPTLSRRENARLACHEWRTVNAGG